jgi:hypothetical protein
MKRSERWGLVHVEPVGRQKTFAFVNPGGFEEVEMAVYPEATREAGGRLRTARVGLHMGLREASQRLGLSAVELSAVERGAMTGDVDAMIAELEASR